MGLSCSTWLRCCPEQGLKEGAASPDPSCDGLSCSLVQRLLRALHQGRNPKTLQAEIDGVNGSKPSSQQPHLVSGCDPKTLQSPVRGSAEPSKALGPDLNANPGLHPHLVRFIVYLKN